MCVVCREILAQHLKWQLCCSHIQNNSSILCTPGAFNFPLMWWHCTWLSCSFLPDPSLSTLMRWRGSFNCPSKNHLVIALWTWELCLGANVPGRISKGKLASGEFSTFCRHINWLKKKRAATHLEKGSQGYLLESNSGGQLTGKCLVASP